MIQLLRWGSRKPKAQLAPAWRWATEEESWDIYIPAPEYGAGAERGVAPWWLNEDRTEKKAADVEWVFSSARRAWLPALTRRGELIVFDGFEVHMPGVPAGGRSRGEI